MTAAKVKKKKTRFKSLENAERRVRLLEQRIKEYEVICGRKDAELNLLARLAATGPAFFNPLTAAEAECVRDARLRNLHMHPDGTFISEPVTG